MTPEERGKKAAKWLALHSWLEHKAAEVIALAIREAVAAETNRCADIAENGEWTPDADDPFCGKQIAAGIRAQREEPPA